MHPRLLVAVFALPLASAAGQSVIVHHQAPPGPVSLYGEVVRFVGDTDGDGVEEYGVSADEIDLVYVYDGATSALRFPVLGLWLGGVVGHSFDGADFDGDGLADIAVGSFFAFELELMSGLDGSWMRSYFGPSRDVAVVGDVDGDAVPDVAGGNSDGSFLPYNCLQLYSGATGTVLHSVAPGTKEGYAVLGPGDLDGDGVPDVMSSAPEVGHGRVRAWSGASHAVLWTVTGTDAFNFLGRRLATVGDVDLDGVPDVATTSQASGLFVQDHVLVLSGADGAALNALPGIDPIGYWGEAIAGPGDLNGDGQPDLLVGHFAGSHDRVELLDALTDALLWSFDAGGLPGVGRSLDGGPDLNGDGAAEILVGQLGGSQPAGSAFLLSSVALPWEALGHSLAGGGGAPLLRGDGALTAGSPLELTVAQAAASAPAVLVTGLGALLGPLKGGVLVPTPDLLVALATDPQGTIELQTAWPTGLPADITLWLQAWIADAGAVQGWSATNALKAEVP